MIEFGLCMARRTVTLAAATALLLAAAGCGKVTSTLGLTGKLAPASPRLIGPQRLRVSLPASGAKAVLGPVSRNGTITVWQTLDGITLSFDGGVLIATRGLGDDLMSADAAGSVAMLNGAGGGYYPQIRSYLDGEDQTVFRSFQCRRGASDGGNPAPGGALATGRRIDETCVSPDRKFTNTYWLDAAGAVIGSRQWVSPAIEYMETERVLR